MVKWIQVRLTAKSSLIVLAAGPQASKLRCMQVRTFFTTESLSTTAKQPCKHTQPASLFNKHSNYISFSAKVWLRTAAYAFSETATAAAPVVLQGHVAHAVSILAPRHPAACKTARKALSR